MYENLKLENKVQTYIQRVSSMDESNDVIRFYEVDSDDENPEMIPLNREASADQSNKTIKQRAKSFANLDPNERLVRSSLSMSFIVQKNTPKLLEHNYNTIVESDDEAT